MDVGDVNGHQETEQMKMAGCYERGQVDRRNTAKGRKRTVDDKGGWDTNQTCKRQVAVEGGSHMLVRTWPCL